MSYEYKLTYFAFRGRAEWIRMMFSTADVIYEDFTLPLKTEITETSRDVDPEDYNIWLELKSKTPFGHLPILDVKAPDGKTLTIAETSAIVRFLARQLNMYGDGELEMAECDMYADLGAELGFNVANWIWESDQGAKISAKPKLDNDIRTYFTFIEKKLEKSNSGFLVGNTLTYVDIGVFRAVEVIAENFINMQNTVLKRCPHVKRHFDLIANVPRIAEHLRKRPNYLY